MTSAAEPAAKPPLLAPKLLIVGAAAALSLLLVAGGLAYWLWPAPVAKPKATKAAHGAVAAAAPAAAASIPRVVAATASAPAAPSAAASLVAVTRPLPADGSASEGAAASESVRPSDEAPLDRLQRRLAQVLRARVEVDARHGGEWRVLTRAVPVASTARDVLAPADVAGTVGHGAHWSYEGLDGPRVWGRLKPEYRSCASGMRQSPIDIRDGLALDLEPVRFDYRPSRFGVLDNGHTVQVNVAPGNSIDIGGRRYELLQFHFHRPSEERINGRQFDMVAHLVHRDAEGRLAVVAVLLARGAAQPLLQTVWNHLPLEKGEEAAARVPLDLNELLPVERGYYTYMGSLTTPPCTEGVLWVVMQRPVQVSSAQIDIFSRLYPMNARPIQQTAGRLIKQSN